MFFDLLSISILHKQHKNKFNKSPNFEGLLIELKIFHEDFLPRWFQVVILQSHFRIFVKKKDVCKVPFTEGKCLQDQEKE